ncbi:hypothetical protein [Massilibacteroides vaginae]|uniref:hypothetical protein n=1 Tax=Massilibacteroides vaginae TaxID=1673718 RepID=UPI00111BE2BA|nr:hypothetical protein [Massilibacteroides vaginae]
MKLTINLKKYYLLGFILLLLTACSEEYDLTDMKPVDTAESTVLVELFTHTGDYQTPTNQQTRTFRGGLSEAMPWVIVFLGDTDQAMFSQVARATKSGNKMVVSLTETTVKTRVMIIANPPAVFFDGTIDNTPLSKDALTSKLTGKTYNEALSILNTPKLQSPQKSIPYAAEDIPATLSITLNKIDNNTAIGTAANKLSLIRVVAKVTVENNSPDFVLEGFSVIGASQYGRLIPSNTFTTQVDKVNYLAAPPHDSICGISSGEPIYIYESLAGESSVIVKGSYKGQSGYYSLLFQDANKNSFNLIRNKWYQFKLKEINTAGYKTIGEALNAPPSNIFSTITVIDQNAMEITDNGQYFIGLSNSEFIVYSNTKQDNLTAVTVSYNAPTGVLAQTKVVAASPAGSITIAKGLDQPNGTNNTSEVKLNLAANFSKGQISIAVGNLERIVQVKRMSPINWIGEIVTFKDNYVSAKIESQGITDSTWLHLSTDLLHFVDTEVVRLDTPGTIYLKTSMNPLLTRIRKGGIIYLSHKEKNGRIKLYLEQGSRNF